MCGIVGHAYSGGKWRSAKSLEHRGPDFHYYFNDGVLNVDFYRLAIKGANGDQPFVSECKNHVVWCNGEIFNYLDLAEKYNVEVSDCDVSVLPGLISQLGFRETVKRLRGFFAIVYYDKITRTIHLGVDHFGIKPLYFQYDKSGLLFGSELKLFSQDEISHTGVKQYLETGATIAPYTLLNNVSSVSAASYVMFSLDDLESQSGEVVYWDPRNDENKNEERSLKDLIEQAFDRNMMSDFPIANLLSGGVDSTAIALGMKGISENIFFDFGQIKPGNLEKRNIERLKEVLKISEISLNPVTLDEIEDYVKACDEIVGDFAGLIYYRLMKQINKKNYRVVMNGTGGDELFFGYARYQKISKLKNLLGLFVNKSPNYRPYDFLKKGFWNNSGISSSFKLSINRSEFKTLTDYYRFIDFKTYLPYTLLKYTDRISSYFQIESRTPFLDVDLVNYIFQEIKGDVVIGTKDPLLEFINSQGVSDLNFTFKEGLGLPIDKMISDEDLRATIIPRILSSKIYQNLEDLSIDKFNYRSRLGKWRIMSLYLLVLWYERQVSS